MWPNPQEIADLVAFNGKLYFFCCASLTKKPRSFLKTGAIVLSNYMTIWIVCHKKDGLDTSLFMWCDNLNKHAIRK